MRLTYADTSSATFNRAQALALTEAQLVDVVRIDVVYDGRIMPNVTATVAFDVRLRTDSRINPGTRPTVAVSPINNRVTAEVRDLIGYTDQVGTPIAERAVSDHASATMALQNQGIGVAATKTFNPTRLTEPNNGPVTVTLSGRPSGPSRTNEMVIVDADPRLWNQYDLTTLNSIALTTPIQRVRVDAYVGGTWSLDDDGAPVITGGGWVNGVPVAGGALTLPTGVTDPGTVQGLRFTFTRADGSNWENPANPLQAVSFRVTRRAELRTGGPTQTDLGDPAPGETLPGRATNTTTVTVTSSDVDGTGRPLTAAANATATLDYAHARNSVIVTKTPDGSLFAPGAPFTYTLRVTNNGAVAITNPVITDLLPADGVGPQVALADNPGFSYTLTGGTEMPTDGDEVTVAAAPDDLVFTFPTGSALEVGATYTISFSATLRPGLAADTQFTNSFGIVGDRPWDACGGVLDPLTGECRASATNTVRSAGAVSITKLVAAEGADVLGTAVDPVAPLGTSCTPDGAGFYARPCIPIAEPGGDITWRLQVTNAGNLPVDRVLVIDSLPTPGDTLATAPILARGSEWTPTLTGVRPTLGDASFGTMNVWFTTSTSSCSSPSPADGGLLCPSLAWQAWPQGQPLPADPADVTGLQFELLPVGTMAAGAGVGIDIAMEAPAFDPAADPTAPQRALDKVAYNTAGIAGRYLIGNAPRYTLTSEPPRVGVALANGPLQVVKLVEGDAAQHAPASFAVALACVSAGVDVPLPSSLAHMTVQADAPVAVNNLPWGADCTLSEEADHGQTSSMSTSATVGRVGQEIQVASLTNVYDAAQVTITKVVDSAAIDHTGTAIDYGPFTVTLECTFLDSPVYANGYSPTHPMVLSLTPGESATLDGLPVGAGCVLTETDAMGASTTSITVEPGDITGDHTLTVELPADGITATVTNSYTVGSILITKVVTGDGSDTPRGPFNVAMQCTLADASGTRTVWDGTIVLGGTAPLLHQIDRLPTGASCTLRETFDGGATSTTIEPGNAVVVGDGTVVTVTVTNHFGGESAGGGSSPGGGTMPNTGSSVTGLVATALAITLAGGFAIAESRQRRTIH